jgi:hypothetical protein
MIFSVFTFFKTKVFLQFELRQKLLGPGKLNEDMP